MTLPSSGPISLSAIANNNSSASLSNLSLQTESVRFASASIVGDVDGNSTANETADRTALRQAPHALSEFRGANFPSSIITDITFTTDGSDTNTVDGEDLDVAFTTNGQAGTYTVRLIDSGGNTDASTTRSGAGTVTFSNLSLTDDTYRPQVEFNTFNVVNDDATFSHHDAIGTITITDPSDTTVANDTATTAIEHQISITNDNAFNDINWTFAKSSGDGSAPSNITNSSDRSPSVNYTGAGVFTIDCRVDGTPSQARNSSTAAQVTHRIDYAKAVTVNNPNSLNEASTITALGQHQGFSSGIDVDLIQASDNSVLLSNDDTTDSRVSITNYNKTFTAPARTDSTLSVKVTAFDGSDSATSNAFNIYPLISQQFDSNDLSFGASAVEVNQNVTLDVANDVTDNIVGYQWSNQGSGNMTVQSGNASAGDTDGTSDDSVSIIDLTDQSHPTVRFDTVEQNKTIRLSLFGRTSQTATADKTIDVELADALSINAISNTNSPNAITVSGNQSGFENGVTAGFVLSSNTTSFVQSTEETTNPDSRFTQRSFSENFTPADQLTTQTLQGRVTADGESDSANTSTFSYFPELKADRNVINPTSMTIFSSTRNTDTSTFPTSQQFGSPTNRTDNITSRTYTEHADSGNAISLSGDTTPSSQTATQPTVNGGVAAGTGTIRYTIEGNTGQSRTHDCAVTVNFSKEIFSVSTPAVAGNDTVNDNITFSFSNQGFNLLSTRFELMDASDGTTQRGNDFDSTSFTGGGLQATNTENVTLTSQASSFGFTAGGTYKIKISLFENDAQSGTPIKTALTDSFQTFSITEFTSTFKGVDTTEGTFIGYASKLLAAENNSTTEGDANRTISQAISGAKLFALNLNQGSTVGRNNTLSTTFDGNEESGQNFFNNDGNVIEINGSDGVIDSVTDATPPTPTLNASTVSTASDDITIRVNVDATVIRSFTVRVTPSGGSTTTQSVNASSQNSSLQQDISLKTIGFSLGSGTAHTIDVRADNEAESSGFSTQRTFSTDSAAAISVSATSFSETTSFDAVIYETSEMTITSSNRGGNAVRLRVLSDPAPSGFEVAHTTNGTHPGTGASYSSIPTPVGSTVTLSDADTIKVRLRRDMSSVGTFSIVFDFIIGSSTSPNTANVTQTFIRSSGFGGGGP